MKAKRFLLFVMAICLASGVKAQFYDSADDIYYYVICNDEEKIVETGYTLIFNFDGKKAANLAPSKLSGWHGQYVNDVKSNLRNNASFYEERVEVSDYDIIFVSSSSSNTTYKMRDEYHDATMYTDSYTYIQKFVFSSDRDKLYYVIESNHSNGKTTTNKYTYKRVDKSFFRVGRSRTPSGTMHE